MLMKSRFGFGRNWKRYLSALAEADVEIAKQSLLAMISTPNGTGPAEAIKGKRFLDVGCGSGLFSLCARSAGCEVVSFDYDPDSVSCTKELRNRYFPGDPGWKVLQGSVLDKTFLSSLDTYDIVYAWGVLHHTGDMWTAMDNVARLVRSGGTLCLAIYNDCGLRSKAWRVIKRFYNVHLVTKIAVSGVFVPYMLSRRTISSIRRGSNLFATYNRQRGMHVLTDLFDWIGGYPYEYAKCDDIVQFYRDRGFVASKVMPTEGTGNHQCCFIHRAATTETPTPSRLPAGS